MDLEHIDKSQETTDRPGQKLVIKVSAVNRLADLVQHLASLL